MTLALVSAPTSRRVARPNAPAKPFTLPHFRAWASDLILDSGESWHPEPFQDAFIEDVFSGIPECWLLVPEGNGKTTLVAGLALYHCEHKQMANVPVAASSREQAEIMYRQAEGFVLRSPRLYESVHSPIQAAKGKQKTNVPRFTCLEGYRRINHNLGGRIQIMAADDRTGDGGIPTLAILDELHRHRDLALYRTWSGKLPKRSGQIVTISTSGAPGSDFEVTREKIRQQAAQTIRKGGAFTRAVSDRVVLHEWALAPDAQPDDFVAVKAANPLKTITVPMLRDKFGSATMTMDHWKRYVCNRATRTQSVAIQEAEWSGAKSDDVIPEGTPVMVGLDVAWKLDTTALVPLWAPDKEHRLFGPATVLVPPRDGTMLDGGRIKGAFVELHKRTPVAVVVMDMSRAEDIAQWLEAELGCIVVDWPQGNTTAAREYERFMDALRNGWLKHSGDAGLTQHALNAITRMLPYGDAVFERPAQSRTTEDQERRVIDALKAAAMVHSYAAAQFDKPAEPVKSRQVVFA